MRHNVPVAEVAPAQAEEDLGALPDRDDGLFEPAQDLYGLRGLGGEAHVQLRDLGAVGGAHVLDDGADDHDLVPQVDLAAEAEAARGVLVQERGPVGHLGRGHAVVKRRVAEAVAEWVPDREIVLVEMAVVDIYAFGEVAGRGFAYAGWVVFFLQSNGVGQLAARVDIAIENVWSWISLRRKTGINEATAN